MLDLENVVYDAGDPPPSKRVGKTVDDRWTSLLNWCIEHPGKTLTINNNRKMYPTSSNLREIAKRRNLHRGYTWHARNKRQPDGSYRIWIWCVRSDVV